MARPDRLRRYGAKDYSQRVTFPVEIVGRDSQVRRYPFEGAVSLYRRRVATAPTRYGDPKTIAAEVQHCRLRIDQLRRSFLQDASVVGFSGEGVLASTLAADVLSFLRRVMGPDVADGALTAASPLAAGAGETWWVPAPTGGGLLLYVFRLDGEGPGGARVELERTIVRLDAARAEAGAERLLVGSVDADLGLLLAGTGEWEGPRGMLTEEEHGEAVAGPSDPLQRALGAFRQGQLASALRQLEAAMEEEPALRALHRAAAVVGHLANEPERAEFAARHGLLLSPGEPHLSYLLALALFRRGEVGEAREIVGSAGGLTDLLASLDSLARGRPAAAWRFARTSAARPAAEWFVRPLAHSCAFLAGSLVVARTCAALAVLLGALLYAGQHEPLGLAAGGAALAALAVGELRTRRMGARALASGSFGRLLLCPPELLPSELPPRPQDG